MAANSALCFWRELLQRTISADMLQTRASEISKSVEKIQEISEKMLSISPNDIRFLLYYAKFLKQIVNSEQEALALYEKA